MGFVFFDQTGFPLGRFARDETPKVVEAITGWPTIKGSHPGRFRRGRIVPLSKSRSLVTVMPENLGDGRCFFGHDAGKAVKRDSPFGDRSTADASMISPGKERGSCG